MRLFEWPIEGIVAAHPGLYLEHHAVMAVAVMSRLSESPCEFLVECEGFGPPDLDGDIQFRMRVAWDEQTAMQAERLRRTEQPKPIVERAAVALAALAFTHLMPKGRMRVTEEGERADYWLPRLRCALEISGTEQHREVPRRQREKAAQVLDNPRQWDGYVFVCCFAATARLIRRSHHRHEERENATP